MPGDRYAPPRTLTQQLVVASRNLRAARAHQAATRITRWVDRCDELLDRWLEGER